MKWFFCPVIMLCLASCVSVSKLPQSSAQADFQSSAEGKMGWSSYRERAVLKKVGLQDAYEAAKTSLAEAGFHLKRADLQAGVVLGEHYVTMKDWNAIAGIYLRPSGQDLEVLVLVEGSKDFGITGDTMSDPYAGMIIASMKKQLTR